MASLVVRAPFQCSETDNISLKTTKMSAPKNSFLTFFSNVWASDSQPSQCCNLLMQLLKLWWPNHQIISLTLHNCNFATVGNHYVNTWHTNPIGVSTNMLSTWTKQINHECLNTYRRGEDSLGTIKYNSWHFYENWLQLLKQRLKVLSYIKYLIARIGNWGLTMDLGMDI